MVLDINALDGYAMSGPQEPSTEEVEFKCLGHGTGPYGHCVYYFWLPIDKASHNEDRCETCVTIEGVISALRTLLFREPWWETMGKAGAPQRETWELEEPEKGNKDTHADEGEAAFGDGMTTKERRNFRRQMEKQFLSTQGSGLTEEEVLSGDVSRATFNSKSSTLVGEDWEGSADPGEGKLVEQMTNGLQELGTGCV